MSLPPPTLLLAGGGTGGHLFPALAIAAELKKRRPDARIVFVGTRGKIEERVVPQHGYEFRTIWISGLQRRLRWNVLILPLKLVVALVQSFFLMRQFKPSAIIGTGGYVCGPVLAAASALGIPVFIHESNSYPGITTRLLASRAKKVFLGFDRARSRLRAGVQTETVGTPSLHAAEQRSPEEARAFFGLQPGKPVLLVTGGSLGSASINGAMLTALDQVAPAANLIWQTGARQLREIQDAVSGRQLGWIGAFIDRMDLAYAAADLILCRAGATTIAEITRIGKPAILVPYPFAAGDHQTHNARSLADAGAALLIADEDLGGCLTQELLSLLRDPDQRTAMGNAARALGRPEAGSRIAAAIMNALERG